MAQFVSVVLDAALDKELEYSLPTEWIPQAKVGMRVEVPIRNYLQKGYIVSIKETASFSQVRPISKILSDIELITPELFKLALWMSKYYCTPLRQVLKTMLPSSVRKETRHKQQFYVMRKKTREELKVYCENMRQKYPSRAQLIDMMLKVTKGVFLSELLEEAQCSRSPLDALVKEGLLEIDIVRVDRSPLTDEEYLKTKPKRLNEEQAAALEKIVLSLENNRYETHLLFGVTGSGKTEVYLQAIDCALKMGKGALMLVPEISLTAQTIERFRSRFDEKIAILHHRLSQGERFDEWHKIRRGESPIVIGARSAIFSPVQNLGLIIVDEEHEHSYKNADEQPCYHARDMAVMRAKMSNCSVILGSATPSLESFYNAHNKKYTLSKLLQRPNTLAMPTISIVDMKKEVEKAKGHVNFSDRLLEGIKRRFEQGEQTILFLNRRGFHTTLLCQRCYETVKCQQCEMSLTFHRGNNTLACHLCGFSLTPPPRQCPKCHHADPMKFRGVGTELIEKNIQSLWPGIRTLRIDADTTRHKGSHQKLLKAFSSGKADVLIGTQMIAKGLHFPSVTLVGILNCDATLNIPDFRSSETVFQLVTQVAGRAGRGEVPGEVILQTYLPENKTIQLAAAGDYENFFQEELQVRQFFHYPPVTNMIKVAFSGKDQKQTYEYAEKVRAWLMAGVENHFEWHQVIPSGYAKIKGQYRYQFLVRGRQLSAVQHKLDIFRQADAVNRKINMRVDVNPISTYF